MNIVQMTLKFIKLKFIYRRLLELFVLKDCEHIFVYADTQNVGRCMQCLHHLIYY